MIQWTAATDSIVTEKDVDRAFSSNHQGVWRFALNLYSILLSCSEKGALPNLPHSVKEGAGLEATHVFAQRTLIRWARNGRI